MHFPSRTKRNKTFTEEISAAVQCNYHTDGTASKSDTEGKFWNTRRVSRQLINQRKRSASKSNRRNTGQETEAEDKNRMTFTTHDNPGGGGGGGVQEGSGGGWWRLIHSQTKKTADFLTEPRICV